MKRKAQAKARKQAYRLAADEVQSDSDIERYSLHIHNEPEKPNCINILYRNYRRKHTKNQVKESDLEIGYIVNG